MVAGLEEDVEVGDAEEGVFDVLRAGDVVVLPAEDFGFGGKGRGGEDFGAEAGFDGDEFELWVLVGL